MTDAVNAPATPPASDAPTTPSQPVVTPPVTEPAAAAPDAGAPPADKPAGDKPVVPEAYAFADLPEGYALSEESLTEWSGVFKELGLTQEQASKLVAMDAKRVLAANSPEAQQAAAVEARNTQVSQWETSIKADPELGGANFEASVGTAQKALAAFGSPELSTMLKESGLGSHPEVVRFFHKVGKELGEGQLHRTTTDVPGEKSWAKRMYPDMN